MPKFTVTSWRPPVDRHAWFGQRRRKTVGPVELVENSDMDLFPRIPIEDPSKHGMGFFGVCGNRFGKRVTIIIVVDGEMRAFQCVPCSRRVGCGANRCSETRDDTGRHEGGGESVWRVGSTHMTDVPEPATK